AALTPLYRQINQLASTQAWRVVVGQFAGQIVMLAQEDDRTEAVLARIVERLQNGRKRISQRAGCSAIMQGSEQVKTAHEQARDALAIGQRIAPHEPLLRFDQLGYLHTLYLAGPRGLTSNPFVPIVRRLREDRSPELLQTLEAYLDAGGNGVLAAEHLHIHRSTLNYRLTRIEQLCQLSLQDPATRANLQVAVKLLRLFDG
ncbi:MAG: helix-turn-helix domain-containing protein, partial [Aggregatilineales bacterium]